MRRALALTASVVFAIAGCSSDSVTAGNLPLGFDLSIAPTTDTLFLAVGQTTPSTIKLTPSATVHGQPVDLPSHVFESSDQAVATVDASGVVTARSVGTATVSVRVNDIRASATIVVLPAVMTVTLTSPVTQTLVGDTVTLVAATLDWTGKLIAGQPITFSSSSQNATVTSAGKVVFSAPGTVMITAKSADATATVTITALPRQFIGGGSTSISSGLDATCGLLPLGRAYCFGKAPVTGIAKDTVCFGDNAALRASCTLVPLQIAGALQLTALAVGDSVACGLTSQGRAYCWGDQTYGQIGNGISSAGTATLPVPVTGPLAQAATFTQLTAGGTHACGLTSTGAALCWGRDTLFQLGGGDNIAVHSSTPIPAAPGQTFTTLAAGHAHTCGLTAAGVAVCWGDNRRGQLGRGSIGNASDDALPVNGPAFTQISASGDNTCGLTAGGAVYCWGANDAGQTGQAASLAVGAPMQIAGAGYTFVAVGGSHACALTATGASCWGSNAYGQLGRPGLSASPTPTAVTGTRIFTALSAGSRTTCAVAVDGAYCWGSSVFGATGNQIQALAVTTPQLVATPQ
jgi:alpha-tubulin suppressor-like RCC1 family protein